jgi:predicted HTH transcriptional regulator
MFFYIPSMNKTELLQKLQDIEWDDFEVKESKNELPKNIWETVSAFANSSGGWIVLGAVQSKKKFEITGIENVEKIEQNFVNALRSKNKFNVLINPKCKKYNINGKTVLAFFISSSEQKPVYFNSLQNTFIRTASGDQRATDAEINALLRDQSFGVRSDLIVEGLGLKDLNKGSLATYRNRVKNQNPQLPYNDLSNAEFCEKLGITKDSILTYGGFSKLPRSAVSKPRNPVIARMFRWAKLAENAGFGFDKMLAWKHKVEFETFTDYSEVAFFLGESNSSVANVTEKVTEKQKIVLREMANNPTISAESLSVTLGISLRKTKENISKLKSKGLIERIGPDKGGHWKVNQSI